MNLIEAMKMEKSVHPRSETPISQKVHGTYV